MLDYELNKRIISLAPKFEAKDLAPDSLEGLVKASSAPMIVYAGASDNTIYGEAYVNHAFRAWHDKLHIALNAPFTLEGETIVALEQARILNQHSEKWAKLVIAEVIGQAEYFKQHGHFPENQIEFIKKYMGVK